MWFETLVVVPLWIMAGFSFLSFAALCWIITDRKENRELIKRQMAMTEEGLKNQREALDAPSMRLFQFNESRKKVSDDEM